MSWTRSLSKLPKKAAALFLVSVLILSVLVLIPTVGLAIPG